jgi:hypothetical protein
MDVRLLKFVCCCWFGLILLLLNVCCAQSVAQYGTDFTFIAQLFPNRNRGCVSLLLDLFSAHVFVPCRCLGRSQIKNKFKKEERSNPRLIDMVRVLNR